MWLEKNDISTLFPPISGEFHGDEFTMVKSMVYHPYKKSSTEETTCSRYTSDTTGFFHGFVTFLREVGVFFSRRRPFEDSPIDPLDLYLARFTQCLGGILKG